MRKVIEQGAESAMLVCTNCEKPFLSVSKMQHWSYNNGRRVFCCDKCKKQSDANYLREYRKKHADRLKLERNKANYQRRKAKRLAEQALAEVKPISAGYTAIQRVPVYHFGIGNI